MTKKITIPQQNQPFRRQSSIGGNVSFRNLGGIDNNNYVVMAIVTKVYYKQGRVDFKLTNSTNHVVTETGDGIGSAPIPVDFYGYQRDGKIFGHYRPIQIGDLIAVAYLWGHKQAPIVLGVYPKNSSSYEFVAPQDASSSGDDKDEATYDYALGDQKIFPDGSLEYHSGNGKYFKTLRGKSFMILDDSPLYEHLWVGYNDIGAFKNSDQEAIQPLQEEAGDWLLVHEDNNEGSNSTDHRTRFYVNKDGTFQVVLSKSSSLDNLVILEGSKSEGFTLQQLYNVPQKGWISENDPHKEPDLKNAQQYVKFNIGGSNRSATIEAATKDDSVEQATKLEIKDDGIYVNDKPLISSNPKYAGKTIIDDTISNSDGLNGAIKKAQDAAEQAAEQAKQAGEIAKQAGLSAEAAGDSAKKMGDDIKHRIVYYASVFPQGDYYVPGKYLAINTDTYIADGTIKNAYIENGAIDQAKIADEAVGSSQIEDLAVTRGKLAYMAVGSAQIEDLAVTDEKVGKLTFDHMIGATLDASKINVINLTADNIKAHSISADSLKIGQLSEITGDAGQITKGHIQASDNPNSGVQIDGLDADNPNKYTPAKKAFLLSEVQKLNSAAEAAIDYGQSTGVDCSAVQTAKQAMDDGLAPLLSDMTATTEFDYTTVINLEQDLQDAINAFHNSSSSKIGKTADGKNTIYRGADDPVTMGEQPHENDMWLQILNDGTYNIRVWDGGQWINPGLADIKAVSDSLSSLPQSYYQPDEPVDDSLHKVQDGDTWYKLTKDSNGNYVYVVYKRENGQWVQLLDSNDVTNQDAIKNLNTSLSKVPQSYYSSTQPAGTDYKDGDIWYKISTNTTNNTVVYTPFKWNPNTNTWNPMLDASSSRNYVGSAPASPIEGDFWMDNTTLKQYQNGTWVVVPTQGPQGIPGKPGADGKTSYFHIAYANSADGKTGFTTSPDTKISYNYMGTYTDYTQAGSTDPTNYTWVAMFDSTKKRNFTTQPTPPYAVGDTWTDRGATYFCINARDNGAYVAKDWTVQQLTIQSLDPSVANGLNNDNLLTGTGNHTVTGANASGYLSNETTDDLLTLFKGLEGQTVTVSVDYEYSGYIAGSGWNRLGWEIQIIGDTAPYVGPWYYPTSGSGSGRISSTFVVPKNITSIREGNGYVEFSGSGTGTVSHLKLEKGSIATNWCLSQSELTTTTGSYRGVTLNDAGLTATAGDTKVAMNSNDGFIINNLKHNSADNPGGQVFHVDTDGNLTISGNLTAGNSPTATISGVNFTGQSLTLTGYLKLTGDNSAISSSGGDVVFNKNGIIATSTSTSGTTTVAIDGTNSPLRIQYNNNDIFKVDNDGNLTISGNLAAGDSPNSTISGVNFTGDSLTLSGSMKVNGQILFANSNGVLSSQGLSLKGGGLSISDSQGNRTTYIKPDGTFTTNKGYFEGDITAHKLILDSSTSSINMGGGVFQVNSEGDVIANSFKSNNVNITGGAFTTGAISSSSISASTITGATIIGGTVDSARFESSGREFSSGAYYPVSDSIYTPSYSTSEEGTINVHSVFPQAFSTVARIGANNKGIDAPYVNITNEAFDRNTASGSIGYGKGYEYPVPYLYGQQGGMPTYPVDSNELSIVWMNDIDQSEDNYGVYDGYKYTEIATIHDIVAKYASKKGRIKLNFGIVCSYDSYDIQNSDWSAGGLHNLYLVLTEGRINGNDTYHIDPGGTTFNNVNNNIKIKMVSKKILTDVTGLSFYNLYAELSTQDLDPVDVYYLGVLQKGFYKSQSKDSNHTWKIQLDGIAVIPDSDILDDQKYYDPLVDGSYRNLAVSGNGSIIAHEEGAEYETTSEYNSTYISFSNYQKGGFPYWTTMSADGIGFSIGNNSASKDGAGNDNGLQTRQCIYFSGDNNYDGMSMDNYGNVHGQVGSGVWRVYNNQGNEVLDVPFDPNGVFNFNVPQSNWGGLKIGWVKFDAWSSADKVPALYNDHDHIKGLALWDRYVVTFIDGFAWNMTDRNGIVANHENVMSTHLLS